MAAQGFDSGARHGVRPCRGHVFDDDGDPQRQLVYREAGGKPLIEDKKCFAGVEGPQGSIGVVTPHRGDAYMSSLKEGLQPFLLLACMLLVSACTAGGPGFRNAGPGNPDLRAISSIFDQDLSAKPAKTPVGATGSGQGGLISRSSGEVAAAPTREAVYRGTGDIDGEVEGQTVSSFEPGEFTINFENADIREVVQSILGNTLGENYVIDRNRANAVFEEVLTSINSHQ